MKKKIKQYNLEDKGLTSLEGGPEKVDFIHIGDKEYTRNEILKM
jgi:hypothetical protein